MGDDAVHYSEETVSGMTNNGKIGGLNTGTDYEKEIMVVNQW